MHRGQKIERSTAMAKEMENVPPDEVPVLRLPPAITRLLIRIMPE
jgi:hypothetical protein